ncbi:LytTR family transcriptional regulator DNA-binding domain-containing protein [Paenibacillus sp. N3/727]|uniref:LytTR family transcriptional regulator DNA-binding domain-containing protein n=1 Tax=Paenibacillus sp. N3/727 TaxID=2925845 RepID=UPI001F52ED92|nr:LytTR family transcriptional regulator DNA-binding domain-containing protein [Paenibacillus sp. N3/727]UNK16793.1 LytTR family transcriptional regulator DNA-binding domain-containing protein [Paenibacillus sp. N3/727]
MMRCAPESRNVYEDFVVETDILFFKTGTHGLVSFHGRNYNIKKRMTAEQITSLLSGKQFFNVGGNCYVNVDKATDVEQGIVFFGEKAPSSKFLRIPRRKQEPLKRLMAGVKQPVT